MNAFDAALHWLFFEEVILHPLGISGLLLIGAWLQRAADRRTERKAGR